MLCLCYKMQQSKEMPKVTLPEGESCVIVASAHRVIVTAQDAVAPLGLAGAFVSLVNLSSDLPPTSM